jgi:hypothetical protein
VSNGENLDAVWKYFEYDVIGELVHRETSRESRDKRNAGASGGKLLDEFEGPLNFGKKPLGNLRVPLAVPRRSFTKITVSCALNE